MEDRLSGIWVYLAQTPLFWLATTLVVYQGADWVYQRTRRLPVLHPVVTAIALLVALLLGTHTPYPSYLDGAQFVHFLLGPATVALAIPLYEQRTLLRQLLLPILGALAVGAVGAILAVVAIAQLLGTSRLTLLSLAPKSVTTPIAMGVAEQIGGVPSLTAVLVILTGIFGAVAAKEILDRVGVQDASARGFAIGLAAHGIGTARAFQLDPQTGTFAGLAMGLNGAVTALVAPVVLRLLELA